MRSLETTILQPKFERLWADSSNRQKDEVSTIIELKDRGRLISWMRNHPSIDLGEKSLRQLRVIGRRLGVKNYTRLTIAELIRAIQNKEKTYGLHEGGTAGEDENNVGRDGANDS